jgi:hypothetical protein
LTTEFTDVAIKFCRNEKGEELPLKTCTENVRPKLDQQNNNLCRYLVKSLKYILRFNASQGVVEAGIDVTLFDFDLTTQNGKIKQDFELVFIPETIAIVNFLFIFQI